MKRTWISVAAATLAAMAALVVSCVSQPVPSETVGEKVRKERVEEYKTPVVLKETVRFADGLVDRVVSYSYDDGYRHLLSTVARKPSLMDPIERVTYDYRDGVLVGKSTFDPDGALSSKSDYSYLDGHLVREIILDGKGTVQSSSEWTWDGGRKSSWRVLSATGLALARTDYFYEGDSLASAKLLGGAGNSKGTIEYVYGEGDTLLAVKYLDAAGGLDGRIEYSLKDGLIAQESVYRADGRLERRLSYEYGPDGALVRRTLADSSGQARETVVYENAYRIDTRIIEYYE